MLSQTINGVLQGIGKSNIPLIAYTVGLVCKFITNIILISKPSIGINGAAIGNIICNMVVFIIVGYYLLKKLKLKLELKRIILDPMFATIFMLIYSVVSMIARHSTIIIPMDNSIRVNLPPIIPVFL